MNGKRVFLHYSKAYFLPITICQNRRFETHGDGTLLQQTRFTVVTVYRSVCPEHTTKDAAAARAQLPTKLSSEGKQASTLLSSLALPEKILTHCCHKLKKGRQNETSWETSLFTFSSRVQKLVWGRGASDMAAPTPSLECSAAKLLDWACRICELFKTFDPSHEL